MKTFLLVLTWIGLCAQVACAAAGLFLPFEKGLPLICFNVPFVFLHLYNLKLIYETY